MVNGDGKQHASAMAEPVPGQASVNESFARALLKASCGESNNLRAVEGTSRNRSRQRNRNSQKSKKQSPADVDDELMQLLASNCEEERLGAAGNIPRGREWST